MKRPMIRRLKHRIPVRLRHHWKVVAACGAFFAVLVGLVGTSRVAPIVTSDERADTDVVTQDVAGTVDLFDTGKTHEITLSYSQDDYDRMVDQFWEDGEKEYVEADLVIDGTSLDSVGIRLKGNSTLSSVTRNGESAPRRMGGPGGGMPNFEGGAPPGMEAMPRGEAMPGGGQGGPGGGFRGGGMGSALKVEEPENLPWLISIDEFVEGRRYQGRSEIAVRPASGMGGSTALTESVALNLLAQSGEPSQRYTNATFTVNDRPAVTRLLVEHPDQAYAESLAGDGVLYKSRASSQFADQGDDPTDYQDDFDQLNKKGSQDLQPVMDLIRWVEKSSEEEFAKGLAERVDVESFARYVALQNLLLNFDDMAGPGKNYYLYYNLDTRKFSVLTWDLNLAMRGDATQGPRDATTMGGFRPQGAGQQGAGQQGAGQQGGPQGGGGPRMGHTLKDRFLASSAFNQVYAAAYRDLYQKLYASGAALAAVDQVSAGLKAAGTDVTTEAASLRTLVENRTKSLATDKVITG
jgi:spore coat protein CotH